MSAYSLLALARGVRWRGFPVWSKLAETLTDWLPRV
jgi:hypothetical protein